MRERKTLSNQNKGPQRDPITSSSHPSLVAQVRTYDDCNKN